VLEQSASLVQGGAQKLSLDTTPSGRQKPPPQSEGELQGVHMGAMVPVVPVVEELLEEDDVVLDPVLPVPVVSPGEPSGSPALNHAVIRAFEVGSRVEPSGIIPSAMAVGTLESPFTEA
jgi:hypothetical protein